MAALLQRQPLTIKQQVEELKNWHKQQQFKLNPQTIGTTSNKKSENLPNLPCNPQSNSKINIDEIPIKVASNSFNSIVENNVADFDSNNEAKTEEKGSKPKFRFLRRGEGIARFNMAPAKVGKKIIPKKHNVGLKLTKDSTKSHPPFRKHEDENSVKNVNSVIAEDVGTLKAPNVKLNITWKSILSSQNPEEVLERAICSNQLELMDPNSSIDSSTASLMEKLISLGKNKLSRDREELRVFEAIEQHMLDSSFCSTSSYVNKLMENAVMSTPNKDTVQSEQTQTLDDIPKNNEQLLCKSIENCAEKSNLHTDGSHTLSNPPVMSAKNDHEQIIEISDTEKKLPNNRNSSEKGNLHSDDIWTKPGVFRNEECDTTFEESIESMHVRFSEHVDYKSFVELSQSVGSISQREENPSSKFDESQEWIEDSEDSNSCCSQCSQRDTSVEHVRSSSPQEKQIENNQFTSQSEKVTPTEDLEISDLRSNHLPDKNDPSFSGCPDNFPPLLLTKLKELEEEIQVFRTENNNIKALRESLERERKIIQEEKRRLYLEKKKLQKELEEERKTLTTQFEEEKQKLAKEKTIFEKYSKSLTKTPSREERKEIQALKEQLAEMKEELNKKESRWGAAQARVRNQVKVLEQDNRKLREEIENFRKQAKYWELFNQKKKGKPFNNTRLIHAISEHISNIVLDDEVGQETVSGQETYFNKNSSIPKTSTISQPDIQSMYGGRVVKENEGITLPNGKNASKSQINSNLEAVTTKRTISNEVNTNSVGVKGNFPANQIPTSTEQSVQSEDRCQKPGLEEETNSTIREITDECGNVEITFPNGNIKKINKITGSEKYIYINGDVEEITQDGTIKYYYSKSRIWQTTLPDGLEIIDFPDGKVEKRHVNGIVEVIYSSNNKKISYPDNSQEIIYTDGTRLKIDSDKTHILTLPNGQKEIHTEEWKRREYPDGTMKTLYPDGTTETVYSNGRVRLKDKFGNLIMDSATTTQSS